MKKETKIPDHRQDEETFENKAKSPGRFVVTWIFAGVTAAALIAGTVHFEGVKNTYKKEIAEIGETYESIRKNAALTGETQKKRVDFYKRRFYIDFPLQHSYAAANLIRKITLTAAGEIRIGGIEIHSAPRGITFSFTGCIKADSETAAQTLFSKFHQALGGWDEVLRIEPEADRVSTAGKQVELCFTIHGEVEPG